MTAPSPPLALIPFEAFADRLNGVSYRTVVREARLNRFPTPVRFAPGSPLLWRADQIDAHIAAILAPLETEAAT